MNICFVDDDQYVIEKFVDGIEWELLGIDLVLTANNIKQAMSILETNKIDILVSDIEMPQGSGLELLEWVREEGLKTACIYVSSYAHFAYAQKAIKLDSKDYLLKPVTNKELIEVLKPIIKALKSEETREIDYYNKNETLWSGILQTLHISDNTMTTYENNQVVLGVLGCNNVEGNFSQQELNRIFFKVKHVVEEIFQSDGINLEAMIRQREGFYVLVIKDVEVGDITSSWGNVKDALADRIRGQWVLYLSQSFVVSQNRIDEQWQELIEMYEQGIPDEERLLVLKSWKGKRTSYKKFHMDLWLNEMTLKNNYEEVGQAIKNQLKQQWQSGYVNRLVYREFRKDFQQMLYHYLKESQIIFSQLIETKEFDHYYDQSIFSLEYMLEFVDIIFKKLEGIKKAKTSSEDVIEQLLVYIEKHPEEDLSRTKLATMAFLSEDYLSKKFTEKTGLSIPYYVSQVRMKKAKSYFEETSLSVSEVALLVGYSNFSYFSKMFREHIGCTPNQFKIKIRTNE